MRGLGAVAVAQDFSLFALIGLGIGLLVRKSIRSKNGQAHPSQGYPASGPAPAPVSPAAGQAQLGRLIVARTPRPVWQKVAAGVGGVALLGLVVAGLLQAANPPAASTVPAAQPYHNDQQGFGITPPVGWVERRSNQPNSAVLFVGPSEGQVAGRALEPIVDVGVGSAAGTLDDVVATQRQQLSATMRLSEDASTIMPGGRPAHLFGGVLYSPTAGQLGTLQLLVVDGAKAYLVSAMTPVDSFGRHEAAIRASLLSFTVG